MNLPNKLTIIRVILVPFFLLFLLVDSIPCNYLLAFVVFALASITDALDGHIARSRNLITDFGKFLDPLADKVLVMAALVGFIECGFIGAVPVIIILAREFMVSGLRLVTAKEGVVVAAGIWGKLKTAFTMVAIIAILLMAQFVPGFSHFGLVCDILIWISAVLTIISGYVYLKGYAKYIDPSK